MIRNYGSPVGPKNQNQNFFTENRIHDLQKGNEDDQTPTASMESQKRKLYSDPQFEKFVNNKLPKQTQQTNVNPFAKKEFPKKNASKDQQFLSPDKYA